MFADTVRGLLVGDLLFGRWKSYDGTRAVFRYTVVNFRKKLCVTSLVEGCRISRSREAVQPILCVDTEADMRRYHLKGTWIASQTIELIKLVWDDS